MNQHKAQAIRQYVKARCKAENVPFSKNAYRKAKRYYLTLPTKLRATV